MTIYLRRSLLLISLLLSSVVFADTLRFDPPNPTSQQPVDAILSGGWPDSCGPVVKNVEIAGSAITLHLTYFDGACLATPSAYTRTFHLNVLPTGSYVVVAMLDPLGSIPSRELARETLVVHGSSGNIRFDPPNATSHHSVDAIVSGIWPDGCVPSAKSVVVTGSTITLHLKADLPPDVGCPQSLTQYSRTFHLDVLPPDRYTVIAVADQNGVSFEQVRAPLIVRDSETLSILPYAVPITGGPIAIASPFFLTGATVTIDGATVPVNSNVDSQLLANAPPHAAGAADIVVNSTAGTVSSKAALIYYDPAAADPAVFEPILFPLSFQGPGAFGSQWVTDSFIFSDGSTAFFRDPVPCSGCSTSISLGSKQLTSDGNPWGHVLYAMRGTTGLLTFASRIRDTSRQTQTAGTEVPIVRERDFRGQLHFLNVPSDARYRATLRLWSLGDFPQFIVQVDPGTNLIAPLSVTPIPGTSMYFGSADVTSLLSQAKTTPVRVTVFPSGYPSSLTPVLFPQIWGMLSITNNDTQQVTILSPQ